MVKNRKEYLQNIRQVAYTVFPIQNVESNTNVHIKVIDPSLSNASSAAYAQYVDNPNKDSQTNFIKNYYLGNNAQRRLLNNIVNDYEQSLMPSNAYSLALTAQNDTIQMNNKRKNIISLVRKRALSTFNQHYNAEKAEHQEAITENSQWLKKLYRKLEQIAKHIVEGDGESLDQREKKFLLSKTMLTSKFLSEIKVRNPKIACQVAEDLKILMLKKKLVFQDAREQQDHNKSTMASFNSDNSQNISQGSMLSEATSTAGSHADQEQAVAKYCDFNQLKRKWNLKDIQQVKVMLRKMLTFKTVAEAQLYAVKKRVQKAKMDQKIRMQNKTQDQKNSKKSKECCKASIKTAKMKENSQITLSSIRLNNKTEIGRKNKGLNGLQEKIRQVLTKGGQFDNPGDKFTRNRNYSVMFRTREGQETYRFGFASQKKN